MPGGLWAQSGDNMGTETGSVLETEREKVVALGGYL